MESVSSSFLIPTAMGPHGHEQERGLPLYQTIYVPSYVTTYLRKYEAN